jgi:hypothetical protein
MAIPKIPDIKDILENPGILQSLRTQPIPVLLEVLERLKQAERALGGATNVPDTPIDMAFQHPKYQWMDAPHLHFLGDRVADAIQRSKEDGESSALLVKMPPRHAKSSSCSQWTPFWHLAKYPEDNILLMGSEHNNAAKWGEKVRRLVETHGEEYNLRLNPQKTARDDWELTTGGGMKCVGAGGQISGNPAKLLIGDDLIKNDEQARSDYQREMMWEWWETTVLQRIEPDTTTILIGTAYHEDDILARVMQHSAAGDGIPFQSISLSAKAEAGDPLGRPVGDGLWMDHPLSGGRTWGQEYYDKKEASVSPYVWDSVYQQRPSSPTGNMVDPTWFRYYRPTETPAHFDQECQSWDLSLDAEKKTDSRHAGLVLSRVGALIYVRTGFAEHCSINKVILTIRGWNGLYPRARAKLIERATAGVALQQTLRAEVAGVLAWPPKGKQKASKEACLDAIIPAIRSGNVLLPLNPDSTIPAWVKDMVNEVSKFPRWAHDDWVDTLSQGVGYLLPGTRAFVDQQHGEALQHQDPVDAIEAHRQQLHAAIAAMTKPRLDEMRGARRGVLPLGHPVRAGPLNRHRWGSSRRRLRYVVASGGPQV